MCRHVSMFDRFVCLHSGVRIQTWLKLVVQKSILLHCLQTQIAFNIIISGVLLVLCCALKCSRTSAVAANAALIRVTDSTALASWSSSVDAKRHQRSKRQFASRYSALYDLSDELYRHTAQLCADYVSSTNPVHSVPSCCPEKSRNS